MNAKHFLRQVRGIDRRIEREEEQIERLRAKLESGRMSQLTGMPRGGSSDWTNTVNALIELEHRYNARLRDMCRMKQEALDAIEGVEQARLREVLELYYLHGYSWQKVAEAMHLDLRWVYRLHGKALNAVKLKARDLEESPPVRAALTGDQDSRHQLQ